MTSSLDGRCINAPTIQHSHRFDTRIIRYCTTQLLLLSVSLLILSSLSPICGLQSQDSLRLRQDLFESSLSDGGKCQPLTISFCNGVNYNYTMMPNFVSHTTQQEASTEIAQYSPLLKVGCSSDIQMFLCSMFAPICFPDQENSPIIKPCKSLCISVRTGCEDIMKRFGFIWPSQLDCKDLPVYGDGTICVGKNSSETTNSYADGAVTSIDKTTQQQQQQHSSANRDFLCPENFKTPADHFSYIFRLNGKIYKNCGTPCEDVLLNKRETNFVRQIVAALALLCILSSAFTCLTFLLDTQRFIYPERPIIIIAFCMLMVGTSYFVAYLIGDQAVCNEPFEPPRSISNVKMVRTIVKGNKKEACTLLFMTLYFFQTATYFWWLMLAISWYMAAGLKWTYEFIESISHYFHLISWSVPAFFTITILAMGEIEGDVNSGTCFVGTWNPETFYTFVMAPMLVCLGVGFLFLLFGFHSLWSVRAKMNMVSTQTDRLDKLMVRIAVFSLLFFIPSCVQWMMYSFEQTHMNSWLLLWLSELCKNREYSIPCPKLIGAPITQPHQLIFITKYLAIMFFGIASGFIVISRKTVQAYTGLYEMVCCTNNESAHRKTPARVADPLTNLEEIEHNYNQNTYYRSVYSGQDGPLSHYPYKSP